jgi:OmpA-OmpF porin, OOP family
MTPLNQRSRIHLAAIACLAALTTLHAVSAQAQDDSYFYLGAGVGQARARIDDQRIAEFVGGAGLRTTNIDHDERHSAYKAFGGYQFNRYVGMEVGYFHMGRFSFNATTTPAGTLNSEFRVQGANVGVVGTMPFTENFSGQARIGAQMARTRTSITGTGAVVVRDREPADRETNVKIGLGLQYAFSRSFMMRAEVERFRFSDAVGNHPQVAMYSISAVFPLGRAPMPMRRAAMPAMPSMPAMTQAPIAPMAQAAPEPAAMPMKEAAATPMAAAPMTPMPAAPLSLPHRVSYEAESLFAFDRSEVQAEGRQMLDRLAVLVRGSRYDVITVQGYADRLGSVAYNQVLSLARANAVKAYLVDSGGLDAKTIVTAGRSESDPVTLPEACKGSMSAYVIACLQPDRRVEVEVMGAR